MPETSDDAGRWYERAFGADYLELYAHRDERDAADAACFVLEALDADDSAGDPILDCACGAGRHLNLYLEAGRRAVGVDLSLDLLRHGRARRAGACRPVVRADMRALPFPEGTFGAVTSLFTSFGYFDDPSEDRRVLSEISRVLRPGALYVLDFLNAPWVRATLAPESERALDDGGRLIERRHIDEASRRVVKRAARVDASGKRREWTEAVRLYEADELEVMLQAASLEPLRRFGAFDRRPHSVDTPRLILIARHKGRNLE